MIDNSYYIILNRLKAFANGHYLINTFTYHEIANFDITKNPHYPIMHAVPLSMNPTKGAIDYSFEITFADWVRAKEDKQENEVTVISDLHRCALDLCAEITNGNILFGDEVTIQGDAIITPFIDEFANTLSGVTLQITIRIPYDWSACDIPANWVDGTGDIPDFGGRSLTMDIYDEGDFVVAAREMNFVGSGVTVTYTGNRAIVTITGGGGGGGAVDSVNGQTGVVVLDAGDVGADAAGSAATALTSANSYTDTQINALDADDIEETATRFWLTSALKTAYDAAVTWIATNGTNILNHLSNTSNPHNVTASQVGLSNVDNTSDLDKPISTATQTALDNLSPNKSKFVVIEQDFMAVGTGSYNQLLTTATLSGTQAGAVGQLNHPGIVALSDSAASNAGFSITTNNNMLLLGGGEKATFVFEDRNTTTRATSYIRMGFIDSVTSALPTDGVFVQIQGGVMTGYARNNNTQTATGTTIAITQNTWYSLTVEIISTTLATFTLYSNEGAVLWTANITTNIPSTTGRETGFGASAYETSTSAAAEILWLDYMRLDINRTLTR